MDVSISHDPFEPDELEPGDPRIAEAVAEATRKAPASKARKPAARKAPAKRARKAPASKARGKSS